MQEVFRRRPIGELVRNEKATDVATNAVNKIFHTANGGSRIADTLGHWSIAALFAIFVALYGLAFAGKLDPFKDNSMLFRFEPIIFIFIGYYFGRLPSRRSEEFFREELARQGLKVDAAQYSKEKAQQERDALEERIRNAYNVLMAIELKRGKEDLKAVAAAMTILDS